MAYLAGQQYVNVGGLWQPASGSLVGTKNVLDVNLVGSAGAVAVVTGTIPTTNVVGSAVTADVSQSGNATISLIGGTFSNLPIAFEASADGGTNWFVIDATQTDGTGINTQMTLLANGGPRNWNVACPGYTHVRVRQTAAATSITVAPTIRINQGPFLTDPSPTVAPIDGQKWTYSTSMNSSGVAGPTGATDLWVLQNPAASGRTIRITRMSMQISLATSAVLILNMLRRSQFNSGGTITNNVPPARADTSSPASVVTTTGTYSAAATALGTAVSGTLRAFRASWPATSGAPKELEWYFGNRPSQALTVRPGEQINLGFNASTAPTLVGDVEWTEE